jgi:hypothetical protein
VRPEGLGTFIHLIGYRSKNSFIAFIVLDGRKENSQVAEECNGEIII